MVVEQDQGKKEVALREFARTINCLSLERGTPDFILAEYLFGCLEAYQKACGARALWFAPPAAELTPRTPPKAQQPLVEGWLNIYPDSQFWHRTEELANSTGAPDRVRCIRVREVPQEVQE